MVRRLVAGVVLGLLAAGAAVCMMGAAAYPRYNGIDPAFPPNDAYVVQDTICCNAAYTDTIVPDGNYVLGWWIEVKSNAASVGVTVQASPADLRTSGTGHLKTETFLVRQGTTSPTFHVPVDTLYVQGVWASVAADSVVHYQVVFEQLKAQ